VFTKVDRVQIVAICEMFGECHGPEPSCTISSLWQMRNLVSCSRERVHCHAPYYIWWGFGPSAVKSFLGDKAMAGPKSGG
jgi:hypothetical protein